MPSVMGLLEEREAAARVRAQELRADMERMTVELADAEAVLERRVIARVELAEALAAGGEQAQASDAGVREAPAVSGKAPAPVVGSVVPRWHEAARADALSVDYRRIVELVESGAGGGEGFSAKQLTAGLGLELVPGKIEGVRCKARRLAERGWLAASPSGRFTRRLPTGPARPGAHKRVGRDGG
ncbi:hypothetical protein SBI_08642 [Streptomyces bingchenggensis BCW-1]|uniref:Uncharacterized protein n=1 Tax=Streptomyces bingchenggensis (strain BCW-1) TaxID=749414 RepID=D7BW50_STRBB|nr:MULTISPECIES: hypothetical protein [Streptomyces]ADI11760.1 hypothetical protein SBI_08642 [Streptomyces bingchenggensis BCW-1]